MLLTYKKHAPESPETCSSYAGCMFYRRRHIEPTKCFVYVKCM